MRPDRPPALLSGHDQGEGYPRQEGHHGTRISGHGGCADILSGRARGILPAQYGPQVGYPDAHIRRRGHARVLHTRSGLLFHPERAHGSGPHGRYLHPRFVGGKRPLAIYQTIQIFGQPQLRLFERQVGRQGRCRLHQAEYIQTAMDTLAGCQGQSGLDLLGLGEPRLERAHPSRCR